jgi:membrane protein required for colicin V production
MNWLDIVVVIIIAAFTLAAFSSGLIREVITLVAAIVGIVVASLFYENLATDVLVFEKNKEAAEAISFLVLFGAVYLLGQIAAHVLKTGAALLMVGPLDHIGGAFFGFIKGLVVVQMLLIIFAAYPSLGLDGAVDNSEIGRLFVDDASFLLPVLPNNIEGKIDDFLAPPTEP